MADQTLAQLVRAKYPDAYTSVSDEDLEAAVIAKYPGVYDHVPRTAADQPPPGVIVYDSPAGPQRPRTRTLQDVAAGVPAPGVPGRPASRSILEAGQDEQNLGARSLNLAQSIGRNLRDDAAGFVQTASAFNSGQHIASRVMGIEPPPSPIDVTRNLVPGMIDFAKTRLNPSWWTETAQNDPGRLVVDVAGMMLGGTQAPRVAGAARTAGRTVGTGVRDAVAAGVEATETVAHAGRALVAPTERAGTRIANATTAHVTRQEAIRAAEAATRAGTTTWQNRMSAAFKPPASRGIEKFRTDVDLAMPHLDQAAGRRGAAINSLEDVLQVIDDAERAAWAEYGRLGASDLPVADLSPVRDAIRNSVTATTRREAPNSITRIEALADRYTGQALLSDVEQLLSEANARIKVLEDAPAAAQGRMIRASDELAAEHAKANAFRRIIDDTLSAASGLDGRASALRRDVAALRTLRDAAANRARIEANAAPMNLVQGVAEVLDTGNPITNVAMGGIRRARADAVRDFNLGHSQFNLALREWRQGRARTPGVMATGPGPRAGSSGVPGMVVRP